MAALSDFAENELLDHLLAVGAYTAPSNIYMALHLGDPGEAGTGNPATTTTRELVTFGAAASGTSTATGSPVARWDSWGATESLTHFSLWDASTAGNCLIVDSLGATISATSGNPVEITSLTVTAA